MPDTTTSGLKFTPYKEKKGEEYMNDKQVAHFREILLAWKRQLMEEVDGTVHHMRDDAASLAGSHGSGPPACHSCTPRPSFLCRA